MHNSSGEAPAGEGEAGGKFMPPPMEPYEISNPEPGVEPPSNPSDLEYAKIKKTVGLMVSFYKGGADKKLEQLNKAKMELEKVRFFLLTKKKKQTKQTTLSFFLPRDAPHPSRDNCMQL